MPRHVETEEAHDVKDDEDGGWSEEKLGVLEEG